MFKPVHRLEKRVNRLVSTRCESLLKSTSGQTIVSSLLPHYSVDFIVDLVLLFRFIIHKVVFVTMSTFAYNFGTFV